MAKENLPFPHQPGINTRDEATDALYDSVHLYLADAFDAGQTMWQRHERKEKQAFIADPDRKLGLQDDVKVKWHRQERFVRAEAMFIIEAGWCWLDGRHLKTLRRDLAAYLPHMPGLYMVLRTNAVKALAAATASIVAWQIIDNAARLAQTQPAMLSTARRGWPADPRIPYIKAAAKLDPADMAVSLQQAQAAFNTVQATKNPASPDYQAVRQRLDDIIEAGQDLGVQPPTAYILPRDIGLDGWFLSAPSQPSVG